MLGIATPLFILQAFCLYHAYRNNAEQRWYWVIIFIPLIGCILYLFHNFSNRNTVQALAQGVQEVVNSNYRVEQLEKALRFNENHANKVNLADAYVGLARYDDAIRLYKECLKGFMADDPDLQMKVLHVSFLKQDFETAIKYGEQLSKEKSFRNAEVRIAYAWALHKSGKTESAQAEFNEMNKSFTNYLHRVEYGKFLKETNQLEALKEIVSELAEEFNHMKGAERRMYRGVMQDIKNLSQNQ